MEKSEQNKYFSLIKVRLARVLPRLMQQLYKQDYISLTAIELQICMRQLYYTSLCAEEGNALRPSVNQG
jgi:hypothetical protein